MTKHKIFLIDNFRASFPFLSAENLGEKSEQPVVYLDNAATTQKPGCVLQAQQRHLRYGNANVHRGAYPLAVQATQAYEGARQSVANFLGAAHARDIVFTSGTTAALNMLAQALGESEYLHTGDVLLLTEQSHHAQLVPWLMLAERLGLTVEYVRVLADGSLDLSDIDAQLSRAKIFALTHVSNVLGLTNDVQFLCRKARQHNALSVVDGAQSVAHMPIDVQAMDCDFYAFSGHKMFAPDGIGALYMRSALAEKLPPFFGGGDMVATVDLHTPRLTFKSPPYKFEAGTPNISGAVALARAVEFVQHWHSPSATQYLAELTTYCLLKMQSLPVRLLNAGEHGIISFVVTGQYGGEHARDEREHDVDYDAFDVAQILGEYGVCVRAGKHCAEPLLSAMHVTTCLRVSFALYNTRAEVDKFIHALRTAIALLAD